MDLNVDTGGLEVYTTYDFRAQNEGSTFLWNVSIHIGTRDMATHTTSIVLFTAVRTSDLT
jgi:hypothetical protein